jgi:glucose-6-phosphate 1-dehydrogenase
MSLLIVVFGATGDLSQRMLMPALVRLQQKNQLPGFKIIGFGRKDLNDGQFRALFKDLPAGFAERLAYVKGDYGAPEGYQKIAGLIPDGADVVFYLTTPPEAYSDIVRQLKATGLSAAKTGWRRIVIEKPFGQDLASAKQLNSVMHDAFKEGQIFRIDHYLAKETVRKLPAINSKEGQSWDNQHVDHVQITVSEELGLEGRGGFYDQTGALRDMVQSHILQVLALLAMEPSEGKSDESLKERKISILRNLKVAGSDIVRAQYRGYAEEVGKTSTTETFVALKIGIMNERWNGVPFYIRTGKRMAARYAEVIVFYKDQSGIVLPINPRPGMPKPELPEGHEVLILKVLQGDTRLFPSSEEVELQWQFIDKIRRLFAETRLCGYDKGTPGPAESDELINRDGRSWVN